MAASFSIRLGVFQSVSYARASLWHIKIPFLTLYFYRVRLFNFCLFRTHVLCEEYPRQFSSESYLRPLDNFLLWDSRRSPPRHRVQFVRILPFSGSFRFPANVPIRGVWRFTRGGNYAHGTPRPMPLLGGTMYSILFPTWYLKILLGVESFYICFLAHRSSQPRNGGSECSDPHLFIYSFIA